MRISSWLTSCACSTSVALCWRTASTTAMAAARRDGLWLLHATSRGYISACGWCRPMRTSSEWMRRRTGTDEVWMRAMTWRVGGGWVGRLRGGSRSVELQQRGGPSAGAATLCCSRALPCPAPHTCGMTTSQVSMLTWPNPSCSAASTSGAAP